MHPVVNLLFGTVYMTVENRKDIVLLHSFRTGVLGNDLPCLRMQSTSHRFSCLMTAIENPILFHIDVA